MGDFIMAFPKQRMRALVLSLAAFFFMSNVLSRPGMAAGTASDALTDLTPIIVTATRTPQSEDEVLASVTLLDRKTIEARQASSVADSEKKAPCTSAAANRITSWCSSTAYR
jgi:outer membrane cobalamin receptor